MIREYVFLGYPLVGEAETHVFVEEDGEILQRCDSRNISTDGEIMKVFGDEFEYIAERYEEEFCPYCIRQIVRM